MKLSEIIKKYEPLGWKFEYLETHLDNFWVFKSPRMKDRRGFKEHIFGVENPEKMEIDENLMLESEIEHFIYRTYDDKIENVFKGIKNDIIRQLEILDSNKTPIPEEIKISFDLKLK